ncbi:3-isopropylmalate dehydrogenase [Williamsia limnetica]|jgi:3-isopropylmalate dehydrogenase|uniref:3-isopropylmalate dehydrogenase n=1 Tax=Williamsia limnetica TaxID=882452 RepID=A0A318RIQ4_WILLI|nr:isocitrate/isopropylmalate family dehydrogenase [Williamsia limnetica]PYE16010.1 3-isopropylmalate dehydrogenase [Williamsia limnetica]
MANRYRIGLIDGDGIGPEIVPAAARVADQALAAVGREVDWVPLELGRTTIDKYGTAMPEATLAALDDLDLWILGPHDSASYPPEHRTGLTPGGVVRKRYDLYANIRPALAHDGVHATNPDLDLVIVRENSEGLYADRNMARGTGEFMPTPDVALSVGVITRAATRRIAVSAFELARSRRKHVTIVHKANVLSMTTGLFRDVCREVAEGYPDVRVDDEHVDAMAAHLVRRGGRFDVIVTENLFGDILSDLAAELAGSLGIAASINTSATKAMAQAAHGAAPDIAGRGVANPVGIIGSTAMLLEWQALRSDDMALRTAAENMRGAIGETLSAGVATADLGGTASTASFVEAVLGALEGPGR